MNPIIKISIFLICFTSIAQEKNIFHDRDFWKENPSLSTVKELIANGNDPVAFNYNGFDATTNAILANADNDVVKYLLSLDGNSIDKSTHDSRIYLHWAAYSGNPKTVKTLLDMGSAMDAKDNRGNTPLTFAAGAGLKDPKIYDLFIANGVDPVAEKNPQGANLLLLAAPFLENEQELAYFIKNGIPLNSTDKDGNGIFNYASKRGNIDLLKLLIKKGVDYKTLNKEGGNAFMFAAQGTRGFTNSFPVYNYLESIGLEPNIVTATGKTPLHQIAYNVTDPDILKLFLKAGASVDQKDLDGNTPFLNAASRNELDIVKLLATHTKDINTANINGQTPSMLAYSNNTPEVVEFLIKNGADISLKDANGNTMAYYLLESFNAEKQENFVAKLKMLQEQGVKMNTAQADGNTLYHLAAKANDLELLKHLETFNIDINAKNNEGTTALHQAAMKAQDDQMLRYLIKMGADKEIITDFGETAYDLASENEVLQKKNTDLKFLK